MKPNLFTLFFLISVLLYFLSPEQYSYGYCFLLHNFFILNAGLLIYKDRVNEKIGFNLLFSLSFYFTNFVYPIFVYPIAPDFSLFSFGGFDPRDISKCTALASLAYSAYSWGYSSCMLQYKDRFSSHYFVNNGTIHRILWCAILYMVIFYVNGGLSYFSDKYTVGIGGESVLISYLLQLFPVITTLLSILILLTENKHNRIVIVLLLSIISLSLLLTGSRSYVLAIFSILFVIFCTIRRVSYKLIFICGILGILLMSFVGLSRSSGNFDISNMELSGNEIGYLSNVADLIINNRNLYSLYGYVEENSVTYGLTMLAPLLAPIPLLQGFIENLFHIPSYMMDSASFSTFLVFGSHPPLGLGTNLVGDTYLAFGLIGTVTLFFLLGHFVIKMRNGMNNGSLYCIVAYLVLVGRAIPLVRVGYFTYLRMLTWTLLVVYILYRGMHSIKKRNKL